MVLICNYELIGGHIFENEVWVNLKLSFYRDMESHFTSCFGFYKYVEYLVQPTSRSTSH